MLQLEGTSEIKPSGFEMVSFWGFVVFNERNIVLKWTLPLNLTRKWSKEELPCHGVVVCPGAPRQIPLHIHGLLGFLLTS